MKNFTILMAVLVCASCANLNQHTEGQMSDYYHWQPAADAKGWIVVLPGSGGLQVLDDEHHYYDFADRFNQHGWSVLLVDYRPAYRASADGPDGTAGEKIAWVTEQAVAWMHSNHPGTTTIPGAIVGWSLGGAGVLRIVNDETKVSALGISSVAAYYPSIEDGLTLNNHVPILIFNGQDDNVTRIADLEALVHDRSSSAGEVELHVYPEAHHAFDVVSLTKRKTIRLFPLIGPRATLHYNEASATDAEKRLVAFLDKNRMNQIR